ncbi:MAG TPA: hypothetical protein VL171_15425 [Verrucomicrobiae bacterium]|nr:hypothetical protein [Verrucomicrobiae bacterium]
MSNVIDWATIDLHFLLLFVLFVFSVKLLHRRFGLGVCGLIVLLIGVMVCDKAYSAEAHIFILLPFAGVLLIYTLASKRLLPRRRLVVGVVALAILTNCAFRSGRAIEAIGLQVDHARFVRHVFYQMGKLPPAEIPSKLQELGDGFMFPPIHGEDAFSPESQRILKIYGLDDDSVRQRTNTLSSTKNLSILASTNKQVKQTAPAE